MSHPEWPALTVADLLQDEQAQLMPPQAVRRLHREPDPRPSTSLIHFQRNRYSVPTEYAHRVVSLRIYPAN